MRALRAHSTMKRFLFALLMPLSAFAADEASEILSTSGVKGGIIVHVGCADGALTQALRQHERYQVHGLTQDAAAVSRIRERLHQAGVNGAVAVEAWDGKHLPYIENFVNLLVIETRPR